MILTKSFITKNVSRNIRSIVEMVEGCGECYLKWVCDAMYCL
jgi:hypothetical protein